MTVTLPLKQNGYDILIERGSLSKAGMFFKLNRKVLVVTDTGVPVQYAQTVASQCKDAVIVTLPQGEQSKNLAHFEMLLKTMLTNGFTRSDCAVAVGGGVVTDITGFASACYMRGIDFYNIPTTLLAQVDASVGGKTAVDLNAIKNAVGAFYQPKGVLIDTDLLNTLDDRQYANGMAEVIKTAVIADEALFCRLEHTPEHRLDEDIIARCIRLKCNVVLQDEKEKGLRKILNFGHTVGHAVESLTGCLHGEGVAVGMCIMCSASVRERLTDLLNKYHLPVQTELSAQDIFKVLSHDKKVNGDSISVIVCDKIGSCSVKELPLASVLLYLEQNGERIYTRTSK